MADEVTSDQTDQKSEEQSDGTLGLQPEENDGTQAQLEDPGAEDPLEGDSEAQKAMVKLCQHYGGLEKFGRRSEIYDARQQRFYDRGDQYVISPTGADMFQMWQPGTSPAGTNGSPAEDTPRYTDVYNIFRPYREIIVSVGVQNPPGVNFEPDDPTQSTDISSARAAEKYRHRVDRVNKRKALQSRVMRLFCTDGRNVMYTRNVYDAQKFGLDDETGQPNCVQLMTSFGVLEGKVVPITAQDQSELVALFLFDDPEINVAKKTYPEHASEITAGQSGICESAYERNARIGVLQGTRLLQQAGDAYAHLSTRQRVFLRPAAFEHAPDAIRDLFKKKFPSGAKVWLCGDAYMRSIEKSMDDQCAIAFPSDGDGMNRPSKLKDLVPVQDAFNDYKNLEKEYADWGIPTIYRLNEAGDIEALRDQAAEPGNQVSVELPSGITSLSDCFFVEPAPSCPIEIIQAYKDLRDALAQFIVGAPPALFGGSDEHNETKGGIAMLRDQAMGRFADCWGSLQELFATAYKQAVTQAAEAMEDDTQINLRIPGKNGRSLVSSISGSDLKKGSFHAYPDTDSSFPETTGSKKQTIQMLWTQAATDPMAAQALGLTEPDNLELTRETMGIGDWVIPGANSRDKQMGEIEILLQQQPAMPSPQAVEQFLEQQKQMVPEHAILGAAAQKLGAPPPPPPQPPEMVPIPIPQMVNGQPVPGPDGKPLTKMTPVPRVLLKTTVPVNKRDFHNFELRTIQDWLSEPDGIEERKTNPLGVLNVELHADEHEMWMQKLAPPPMPAPPPMKKNNKPNVPPPGPVQQGAMNAPIQ